MLRKFLLILTVALISASSSADTYRVTARTSLSMRSAPSVKGNVVAKLTTGQMVEVISIKDGWAKISYAGKIGFVSTKFLKRVKGNKNSNKMEQELANALRTATSQNHNEEPLAEEETTPAQTNNIRTESQNQESCLLFDGNSVSTSDIEIYLAGQLGLGYSTMTWDGGNVRGKFGCSLDAVLQIDFRRRVAFIPKQWYSEISLGYKYIGADQLGMHYVGLNIIPFGYRWGFNPRLSLVGKAGIYLAFPLNGVDTGSRSFSGNFECGVTGGVQVEYGTYGVGVNVGYDFCNALKGLKENSIHNLAVMGTLIYKFGKL